MDYLEKILKQFGDGKNAVIETDKFSLDVTGSAPYDDVVEIEKIKVSRAYRPEEIGHVSDQLVEKLNHHSNSVGKSWRVLETIHDTAKIVSGTFSHRNQQYRTYKVVVDTDGYTFTPMRHNDIDLPWEYENSIKMPNEMLEGLIKALIGETNV